VTSAPVLQIFDPTAKKIELLTDASAKAIGAVLLQGNTPATMHPVAYFSHKLNAAQQNYSTTDRELLAIKEALGHFRHVLVGLDFVVRTDHQPLTHFFSQPNLSSRQMRWLELLTEFLPGLKIMYQRGADNLIPDTLSRRPDYLSVLRSTYGDNKPRAQATTAVSTTVL